MKYLTPDHAKRFDELKKQLSASIASINTAIDEANDLIKEVNEFSNEVAEGIEETIEERSEKWHESEAGQRVAEDLETWRAELDELYVDLDDLEKFAERPISSKGGGE